MSGGGTFDIAGEFTYQENFVAVGGPATFNFQIIPGQLDARQFYGPMASDMPVGEELFARYEIDIRLDGASIWSSTGELGVNDTGSFSAFTGTSIGGILTLGSTSANYSWGTYNGSVPLGSFSAGDTFLLEYDLRTLARGNVDPTGCIGGDGGDNGVGHPTIGNGHGHIPERRSLRHRGQHKQHRGCRARGSIRTGEPGDLRRGPRGHRRDAAPARRLIRSCANEPGGVPSAPG